MCVIFVFQGHDDSYMIVTKVKDDCQIKGGILKCLDRIIAVNSESIVSYSKEKVKGILNTIQESDVVLSVTYPDVHQVLSLCKGKHEEPSPGSHSSNLSRQTNFKDCKSVENAKNPFISKPASIDSDCGSKENVNSETFSLELREHKGYCVDCGMETSAGFYNGNTLHNRNSDESCETILSGDASEHEPRTVRRELSELSESSSNRSVNSNCPLLKEENMRRSKSENKPSRPKFTVETPSGSEMEPLHRMDFSPTPAGRFSQITVEDMSRAHSLPITNETAVSMQDINVFEEHTHSLPVGMYCV